MKFLRQRLLTYLVKLLRDDNRETVKLLPEEEFRLYRFREPDDTLTILRAVRTAQLVRHYEAATDEERAYAKGAAIILSVIIECHRRAAAIHEGTTDDLKQLDAWHRFRKVNRVN